MSNTYTVKTVIIPNPTLAAHFHCLRERAMGQIVAYFKEKGVGATVNPEWVRGPYTGVERCIELQLVLPPSMLSDSDAIAPFWKFVWELGKAG